MNKPASVMLRCPYGRAYAATSSGMDCGYADCKCRAAAQAAAALTKRLTSTFGDLVDLPMPKEEKPVGSKQPGSTAHRTFLVEGDGEFPYDMLRYEQCWPATSSDALAMEYRDSKRRVRLATDSLYQPHTARWDSFQWHVINEDGMRL